ncbi:MAG: hypothetical protein JNN11_00565 [Candidatus Doudnabacteria bacterium]|nr:hypothetical protein [Candidatus Doudnabacteria bacterium]
MSENKKIYCSLDIETSGFDPLKDEILEVGFVKFQISPARSGHSGGNSEFQILEEWTRVFKPTKPVDAKILGLTGIKQAELDAAPEFSEYKEILQSKISGTVIVGHNVVFDIKFLEEVGIVFSGQVVDTLDLVQWILPTHHSYNLENLMHYFGIKHPDAHRALADAKACLEVLKCMLKEFSAFSRELKSNIYSLIEPFAFEWKDLLKKTNNNWVELGSVVKRKNKSKKEDLQKLKFKAGHIYNFVLQEDWQEAVLKNLSLVRKKSLIVFPKKQDAVRFWKEEGVGVVWEGRYAFDKTKFQAFKNKTLSPEEAKFCLKVLVWEDTNWQTESVYDLNLSFFGAQFKDYVTTGTVVSNEKEKVLSCDINTFLLLEKNGDFQNRQIVFVGLAEFEQAISSNLTEKVSWSYVNYILKTIYNPEINYGKIEHKKTVEDLLNASDLFFGLVSAILQTDPPGFLDVSLTDEFVSSVNYNKVKEAAASFAAKLNSWGKVLESEDLQNVENNLNKFFSQESNRVKWIELSEKRCAFNNAPLLISEYADEIFKKHKSSFFVDSLAPRQTVKYFVDRLGVSLWGYEEVKLEKGSSDDLFSRMAKVTCHALSKGLDSGELLKLLSDSSLPAAVLFGSPKILKDFYSEHYEYLKSFASLSVQNSTGGTNKLFNNFKINSNGVLLATDRTILKAILSNTENSRPVKLGVKTLVVLRLPFDPVSHPYAQALAAIYPNAFQAMALPKALYNFHKLVTFFSSKDLRSIYLCDLKLGKEYAQAFCEYLDVYSGKA